VFIEQNPILRRISGVIFARFNARQTNAVYEGPSINAYNTVGNRYTYQTTATKKGPSHNIGYFVANRHAP
tara:strand:+ start:103 stop:312 length:210 start_codon:yes stop_codon:yes gene_type:complete